MPGYELIGKEEKKAIDRLFDEGAVLFRHGFDLRRKHFHVIELQTEFAKWMGMKCALATTSGTSALKVGLKTLGIKPGDEVITSAFTFVATVEAILDSGAKPVIVNVDETLNIDPSEIERAVTKKTRGIIPVHMLGVAARMDEIMAIARRHKLAVLEDNCESLGAKWNGKNLGFHGDFSAISLDFGKMVTCGDGGMLFTNSPKLFKLAEEYHDHGHMNNPKFPRGKDTHRIYGFNFRMTELQAVVAKEQLKKLDWMLKKNSDHYEFLLNRLSNVKGITLRAIPRQCSPSHDTLIFHLSSKAMADKFAEKMTKVGLGTKNIPSAMEWHFAGFWDHMTAEMGFSNKKQLWKKLLPTYDILSRSIALPINVLTTKEELGETAKKLQTIAKELL